MNKLESVAYVVMENTSDPQKPQNLKVVKDNSLFYVNFDTNLQSFGVFNRNRRKYMDTPMMEGLEAEHITELLMNNTWFGEAGHPDSKDPARIVTIDPKLTSHRINKFWKNGNILKGNIDTLDDGMYGTRMTKNILQGMEPAFSLRALAPLLKNADGSSVIQKRPHIVTYDWVILPSHKEAYRDTASKIEKISKVIESSGNTFSDSLVPVQESSLLNFIGEESKNIKLVSNVCEVLKESMVLTNDLKYAILKEGNETFYVKIEEKIKHDVRRYMTGL